MQNFLKLLFWGNLVNQLIIVVLFWGLAGAVYYQYNYVGQDNNNFLIVTMIISFMFSIAIHMKVQKHEQENQSIERAIEKGISRAMHSGRHNLSEVILIGLMTLGITFFLFLTLPYFMYIAPSYSVYVLGVQLYKKKKLSVQN